MLMFYVDYLIITQSLNNLRNVEQDGILIKDKKSHKKAAGDLIMVPNSISVTYWREGA